MLIKDLEFNPQFTDEQYDTAIKFFSTMGRDKSCTKYIIIGDGDDVMPNPRAQCHAAIGYNQVANPALVGTEIALKRLELTECEGAWKFLDWMLNDSFAARFIVNKPEHRALDWVSENGIIVSTDVMQPLFQLIMIFSRTHSERSAKQFTKWKQMVDDGFDPHFAYQVCMCVTAGPGQTFMPDQIVNTRTSHTTTYVLNLECLKNFCAGELGEAIYQHLHYRVNKSVHGCHALFQATPISVGYLHNFWKDLFKDDADFRKRMSEFRNEDSSLDSYRPPNPFTKPQFITPKKPDDVTYQEYFEVVIPYMKEKGMFYNAPES